jgi:hypothetical protein
MHREGDNFVALAGVGSVAEVDAAGGSTYFWDAEKLQLHVKLMPKPGQPIGAVWFETY